MVKYLVANEVPRVRFPDGAFLAFVAQLAARGSHNPKVAGSTPVESILTLKDYIHMKLKWWFRWDSNPRPQDGLELESSALDHSATKPYSVAAKGRHLRDSNSRGQSPLT